MVNGILKNEINFYEISWLVQNIWLCKVRVWQVVILGKGVDLPQEGYVIEGTFEFSLDDDEWIKFGKLGQTLQSKSTNSGHLILYIIYYGDCSVPLSSGFMSAYPSWYIYIAVVIFFLVNTYHMLSLHL